MYMIFTPKEYGANYERRALLPNPMRQPRLQKNLLKALLPQ